MNILICGAGRVGQGIASRLSQDGHNVTIVDADAALVKTVTSELDVNGIAGHAAHPEVLRSAGAESADMLIAVTYYDEVNMVTCQVAHTLFQTPMKVARVRAQSYLRPQWSDIFSDAGLPVDVVISPEIEVGRSILRRLQTPGAFLSADFAKGQIKLVGFDVSEQAPIANTALEQIHGIFPDLSARVVGVGRKERLFAPIGTDQLVPGDRAYITLRSDESERLVDLFGTQDTASRRIVIVGGGNIGLYVARELEKTRTTRVRVIEGNLARAETAAAALNRGIVIHGDALNPETLEEAGVGQSDVVVGLTNDDKVNLLLSAMAKRMGAKKTIALVNSVDLQSIRNNLDLDVTVDPRAVTISQILLQLRRGRIVALQALEGGMAEVAEGVVQESSALLDSTLNYSVLPDGLVAGALIRKDRILPIDGNNKVKVDDHVVLFSERDKVKRVEQMFRVSPDFF